MAQKKQPYGIPAGDQPYGTYERQPLAPFNAVGVLAPTLAANTYAENAVQSYNINQYNNEGMAQDREARAAYHPYRMGQVPYNGQADVLDTQAGRNRSAAGAFRAGVNYDQLDPMVDRSMFGVDKETGDPTLGERVAPTAENPHMQANQSAYFSGVQNNDPYTAPSSLPPSPNGSAGAGAATGSGQLPDPLAGATADPNTPAIDIAGGGIVPPSTDAPGAPQVAPSTAAVYGLREGVNKTVGGMATTRLKELQSTHNNLRNERQQLVDKLKYAQGIGDSTAVRNLTFGIQEIDGELADSTSALTGHIKYMQDSIYENKNQGATTGAPTNTPGANYGSPEISNDPIFETKGTGNNDSYDPAATIPPPANMPKALIEPFKQAASLYQQYAPGGYGGTETGLLIAALESDFRPGAKNTGHIGMTQFSQDTFNRIAKQTAWGKGMSAQELRLARTKPAYQAKAERQYRHNNYVKAVTKYKGMFDPNNPLNLYAQHHFGEDTGAKIAAAYKLNRNTPLSKAMGAGAYNKALAENSYLAVNGRELTVGELYSNWINRAKERGFYGGVRA